MPYDTTESLVEGINSLQMNSNSINNMEYNSSVTGSSRPPHPPSRKPYGYEGNSSGSPAVTTEQETGRTCISGIVSKHPYKSPHSNMLENGDQGGFNKLKEKIHGLGALDNESGQNNDQKQDLIFASRRNDEKNHTSNGLLETVDFTSSRAIGDIDLINAYLPLKSGIDNCPSPQNSFYSATQYTEAKQSFTNTEVSERASSDEKSGESREVSNSCDYVECRKTGIRCSTGSDVSDESSSSSFHSAVYKPHKANDTMWEAIQVVRSHNNGVLELKNFRVFKRLGGGDIGTVHLAELIGTRCCFAIKVMDKEVLASRKKLLRAQTEKEILQSLDHPFLPTLYAHFETEKLAFLVMEFCPGGDLHSLRQRQPGKFFPEHAARFYVAEVLLALEYLHMLGIIYRDLKPENVLVREDGHIMLSDFDLSLRCAVNPTLVKSSNINLESKNSGFCIEPSCVIQPSCIQPSCFGPRFLSKTKKERKTKQKSEISNQASALPELMAEPTSARSMSFVGTHEYLAPEIIKGEGHGSAVDWWTFGIFLYELLFGRTPFKGAGNRATLFNVVGQPLRFPESPTVSFAARDLIRGLLVKEPQHRLAYRRGATEIKQHPFFQNVNWALIRCASPPDIPPPFLTQDGRAPAPAPAATPAPSKVQGVDVKPSDVQRRSKKRKRGGRSRRKKQEDCSPAAAASNNASVSSSTCASSIVKSDSKSSSSFLDKMKAKLSGGYFRMINEKLYTCSGDEALNYFKEDPALFKVYHSGYQEQMSHWPVHPNDIIIKWINDRSPSIVVADFGCGDARLSRSVKNKVFSFDLVSNDPAVIACDMSNTPLDTSSVDVAVFCLSLMGTNFPNYLQEANRVLKHRGWLLIAEVKSRFDPNTGGADPNEFVKSTCELGFTSATQDFSNKMFLLFYFQKEKQRHKEQRIKWPELKPCLYKRR